MLRRFLLAAPCALALLAPTDAFAQKTIKVGFPMILSGPGALFGEPALKGAQMYVDEINAKGGVLGRKIELIPRDTKGTPTRRYAFRASWSSRTTSISWSARSPRPKAPRSRRSPRRTRWSSSRRSRRPIG